MRRFCGTLIGAVAAVCALADETVLTSVPHFPARWQARAVAEIKRLMAEKHQCSSVDRIDILPDTDEDASHAQKSGLVTSERWVAVGCGARIRYWVDWGQSGFDIGDRGPDS